MAVLTLLILNAITCVVAFLLLWLVCLALRDVTLVDSFWGLGMVLLALSSFVQSPENGRRGLLLLGLCAAWGFRLGAYLFWRWRRQGADRRYVSLLGKAEARRGWRFPQASLRLVFAVQAPLLFIVCLPVQLGQIGAGARPLGPLAAVGALLSLFGLAFESLGDLQLVKFRAAAVNSGKVLNTGLWRFTRHPNYFGDACVWWGLYLIAAEGPFGVWALPGPVLLTWTLMKWSGAPTLEHRLRKTKPGYAHYVETTSGFLPWPPRRGAVGGSGDEHPFRGERN